MIGWGSKVRVYAYCAPVNMRLGFEGLAGLVRRELERDPLSGELFLFTNRRRNYVKVLFFDGSGMCLLAKKIEKRRFGALWDFSRSKEIMLTRSELELFLEGSQLVGRYQMAPPPLTNKDLAVRS